ncbi:Casein kinase ii subunit beta, partial [Globisporangium splendens]
MSQRYNGNVAQQQQDAEMERLYGQIGDLNVDQDDEEQFQRHHHHHENDVEGSDSLSSEDESSEDEDDEDEDEDDNDVEGSEEETSWINWFCSLRENAFLCEVDEDYIEDDFNLTGLSSVVPYYDYALDVILDIETPHDQNLTQIQQEMIESAAEMLYGLIHARYILTTKGMAAMLEKYQSVDFGRCHRVYCQGQPVLPVGQSDVPRHTTVNVFCPKCRDIFFPKSQRAGLPSPPTQEYVPRVYGYKVHRSSEYYTGKKKAPASASGAANASGGRGDKEKYRKVQNLIDRLKGRPNDGQQLEQPR